MKRWIAFLRCVTLCLAAFASMGAAEDDPVTLGIAAFRSGHYDVAAYHFSRALQDEGLSEASRANVLYNRGMIYRIRTDFDRALADLNAAVALEPSSVTYLVGRASIFALMGDPGRALADYGAVLAVDPANAMAYFQRGDLYAGNQRLDRALSDYREAAALQPDFQAVQLQIGQVLLRQGNFAGALASLNRAVVLDPTALALHSRAAAYLTMGRLDDAITDLDAALALEPDDARARQNRGLALAGKGEHARAIADFDRAIQAHPEDAGAYLNRGNSLAARGEARRALADYDAAVRLDPANPTALNNRASLLEAMGEKDRALADLDRLLAVDPAATDGYRRRGRTRFDRGDFSGAAQDFRVYFQRFPEDPYGLVWMYISTARAGGDVDRALHDLRQVASAEDTWSGMLIRMFRGELPPSSLLESASSVTDDRIRRQRLREAHLHVAEFYLIHGKPYEARISLEEIVATDRSQSAEFATARAELERLRN